MLLASHKWFTFNHCIRNSTDFNGAKFIITNPSAHSISSEIQTKQIANKSNKYFFQYDEVLWKVTSRSDNKTRYKSQLFTLH